MKTKKICLGALLAALTCVATMIIQIPIPATGGYINVGDSLVLICGIFFGPYFGFICGGLGSALADLISGYSSYVLPTFVIKGLEGLIAAHIAGSIFASDEFFAIRRVGAAVVSVLWMVLGYFAVEILMVDFTSALGSVTGNLIQAISSVIIFFVLGFALYKAKVANFIKE